MHNENMSEKKTAEVLVGESFFSSAFFQPLLRRISSPEVSDLFKTSLKVNKKTLNDLESNLLTLDAVLDDAELKAYENKQVKAWFDEVNKVACDLEDLLDKIDSDSLNRLDKQLWNIITPFWSKSSSPAKQLLKDVASHVKDLERRRKALGLRKAYCQVSSGGGFEDEVVFGRDEDKEAIVKLLLSDGVSAHDRTDVIAMVGKCGVGKTTLARLVYDDERVKKHFDFKCWIYISEEYDDLLLTKAIFHAFFSYQQPDVVENLDSDDFDGLLSTEASSFQGQQSEIEDLDSLQTRLKESLIRKRFLLVLDNLSVGIDWRSLRKTLTAGANGSKIMVTTCHSQLKAMSTLPAYTLKHLQDKESWMLFVKHAFPDKISTSLHPKVEAIGKEITDKCCGLPIAAKVLGTVLRFKPVEVWHAVLNADLLWRDRNLLTSLLKMSYKDLPLHLKRCVAYCSIFPKYHEFEEEKLVRLWMAEGFLQHKEDTKGMEEVGSEYFHDLIYRSFFQPSGASKSSFIMHDLLYDLAHSESGFICSRMGNDNIAQSIVVSSTPWHLLISGGNDIAEHCKGSSASTLLRTLILYKSTWDNESRRLSGEQLNNLFEALRHLRVLTLSRCDITKLPDSIRKLKCLRFLDLSHNAITQLPACVSSLSHLQTLSLSHCSRLIELPDSFHELKNLLFLDFSHTAITKLPDHVSSLVNLQTLLLSHCSCLFELPDSFQELKSLHCLDLSHTSITSLPDSVGSLYKLQKLLLSHCYHLTELPDLFKLKNLQLLDLSHTAITSLPDSVTSLYKLQKMLLSHCSRLTELPDTFWKLQNLQFLDLSHSAITSLPDSLSYLNGLQTVLLSDCHSVTALPENMRKLVNLRHLDIRGTHLKKMPAYMGRLTKLQDLSDFVVAKDSGSKIKELGILTNLRETLHISQLQNVESSGDAYEAHLKKKNNLKGLVLRWSEDRVDFQGDTDVLEQLKPNKNLEHLTIISYGGTRFPEWLGDSSFSKMVFVHLSNCNSCSHLPPLGQLPSLKVLQIKQMNGVKRVGSEFYGTNSSAKPFPSLEILVFREMLEWEEWISSRVDGEVFPCLKQLYISRCPKLARCSSLCLPLSAKVVTIQCPLLRVPVTDDLQSHDGNEMQSRGNDKLAVGSLQALQLRDTNAVQRTDVSIISKSLSPELPQCLSDESSAKQGGTSENYSTAIKISSDTNTDGQINLEERLVDIEASKRWPPESSKRQTEDSSCKRGGASDNYLDTTKTSSDTNNDDTINLEESLDNIEASKASHPESPKSSSAKHGGASDNGSAATEISSDIDTDDPSDNIEEESLEDVSSPEHESLNVSEISQLKRLPLKLRSLKIEGCAGLKSLHEKSLHDNPYLGHLYIIDCHFLKSIHDSHLPIMLKTLYIHKCKKLEFLETMGEHTSLEDLCIESSCDSLLSFPLAFFPKLRNLSIRDCANFNSISIGLKDHLSLDVLEIRDCAKLISFPEGGLRIPSLTSIVLSNCKNLKVLPGQLYSLTSLQSLIINECPELESIPEGGLPSSLNLVCINSCYKLTPRTEWGLYKFESFSCIEIESGCRDLESFPEQNLLPRNLTSLRISRLMNLKFLNNKGLEHLTSLETLKINSCNKLQSFPDEGLPSSVTCLCITDCPLLKSKLRNRRGKEWYKIAHIPHIQIDMEVIS